MRPNKAFIIYVETERSIEYAKTSVESCKKVGIEPMLAKGYYDIPAIDLWAKLQIDGNNGITSKAASVTANHFMIWQLIADMDEPVIVLEHDAVMLEKVNIDIEDGAIYLLGYKFENIEEMLDRTGNEQKAIDVENHEGAHAYAITPNTAKMLLKELTQIGARMAIDDTYFIRYNNQGSKVPLKIVSPTPAVGWLRQSTIWKESSNKNAEIVAELK